jgi:hypothetical protein
MEILMNKLLVALCASTCVLPFTSAFADDETPPDFTPSEQATYKQEADAKKAAAAKMTPEQKVSATEARRTETLKYQNMIEGRTQNPQWASTNILKSAAASKAGPTPPRGTINTPEAENFLMKDKGQ